MTMKQLKVLTAIKEDQIKYCKCFEEKRQLLQSGSTGPEKTGKVDFQVEAHEQSHRSKKAHVRNNEYSVLDARGENEGVTRFGG